MSLYLIENILYIRVVLNNLSIFNFYSNYFNLLLFLLTFIFMYFCVCGNILELIIELFQFQMIFF
jgi:hypothetical protein